MVGKWVSQDLYQIQLKRLTIKVLSIQINYASKKILVGRFSCNIKRPPAQVEEIHSQIIQMIQTTLQHQGHELQEDGRGTTLVTVVNASRTQEDIERDMIAAKLSGNSIDYT